MVEVGSPRRAFMLSMGLILYVILISLLMFYIEECSVETKQEKTIKGGMADIEKHCRLIYSSFEGVEISMGISKVDSNASIEGCVRIVSKLTRPKQDIQSTNCRFNSQNFFPWVHCITLSIMTIGGSRMPATVGGQWLLTISMIFGLFPLVRLFIHVGAILSSALEHLILAFELQVLNRSPRMIHNVFRKLLTFNGLLLLLYNFAMAWITSRQFYGTNWSFPEAVSFWFQGMLTSGRRIEAEDVADMYSNGGWRILCIDLGMIGNMILSSSFVCIIVSRMHKKICHASKTIKHSFKRQNPEIYVQIKPLKTHL